jgi:cell division protein FtsB
MLRPILKRFQILLIAVFVLAVLLIAFIPKIQERSRLVEKHEELLEKIERIEQEIAALRENELAVQNDPYYLEKLARDKLGFSGPDEIIYQFDKPAANSPSRAKNGIPR